MLALTWQGPTKVEVREVPEPVLQEPTDIVLRVTSTAICGSDLHLYGVMGPYLTPGAILGHEFMGVVEQVGGAVVGQLASRCALLLGASRVIGLDLVPERLSLAAAHGVETVDVAAVDDPAAAVLDATGGHGVDAVVEAVGMEASGGVVNTVAGAAASLTGRLPKPLGQAAMEKVGVDRLAALHASFQIVCRGGTVSMLGDELLEIVGRADDVLGLESLATHHVPLSGAPAAYDSARSRTAVSRSSWIRPDKRCVRGAEPCPTSPTCRRSPPSPRTGRAPSQNCGPCRTTASTAGSAEAG